MWCDVLNNNLAQKIHTLTFWTISYKGMTPTIIYVTCYTNIYGDAATVLASGHSGFDTKMVLKCIVTTCQKPLSQVDAMLGYNKPFYEAGNLWKSWH